MTDKPIVPPEQFLYTIINQMMDKYESHPLTRAVFEMGYVKEGYRLDWNKRLDENGEWSCKKMTENKRFKYSSSLEKVYDCDTFNGETTESYGTFECCDMLNQLNDENEQLKVNYKELRYANNIYCNKIDSLKKENEQLKQSVNNLKDTIVTIGIAYQRKYDRTLVDLVDEVHDEDITDLIKELKE